MCPLHTLMYLVMTTCIGRYYYNTYEHRRKLRYRIVSQLDFHGLVTSLGAYGEQSHTQKVKKLVLGWLKTRVAQAAFGPGWHGVTQNKKERLSSHFWVDLILASVQWGFRERQWLISLGVSRLGGTGSQPSKHVCRPCPGMLRGNWWRKELVC